MGVRILYDSEQDMACLYCSTSDWAFGHVFYGMREPLIDAQELADGFIRWLLVDARTLSDEELSAQCTDFLHRAEKDGKFWEWDKCESCGEAFPNLIEVEDEDRSVGYLATLELCEACHAKRKN